MTRGIAYDFQFHFINLAGLINLQIHDCTFWIILRIYIRKWNAAYSPPKSCMPSRAKMRMNRNSRNKSDMMERMLLSSEITRFRSDGQYLPTTTASTSVRRKQSRKSEIL